MDRLRRGPPFYDLAQQRWVPADAGQASADGAAYAYSTLNTSNPGAPFQIHVVQVASASDRIFTVQPGLDSANAIGAFVSDFDGTYVYFSVRQSKGLQVGVWRLDVRSGAAEQLSKESGVVQIRGGYAWLDRQDPRDPAPPQTGPGGPTSDSIVRLDLFTGEKIVWYYAPGKLVVMQGLDRFGIPIVAIGAAPTYAADEIGLVASPGNPGVLIYGGGSLYFLGPQPDLGGRLWFGNDRGIYLYTPSTGLEKVFAYPGDVTLGVTVQPAGYCL